MLGTYVGPDYKIKCWTVRFQIPATLAAKINFSSGVQLRLTSRIEKVFFAFR